MALVFTRASMPVAWARPRDPEIRGMENTRKPKEVMRATPPNLSLIVFLNISGFNLK